MTNTANVKKEKPIQSKKQKSPGIIVIIRTNILICFDIRNFYC